MKTFVLAFFVFSYSCSSYAQSDAFAKLKTLDGTWEGKMMTTPAFEGVNGSATKVTLRVTSMGNALMHEMTGAGRPDDPITMMYLDSGQLTMTHYCDAGNRPRMRGKLSEDKQQVEFDFVDLAGPTDYGHMHHALFTVVDADHHVEEWTFMMPGDKPVKARVELTRMTPATTPATGKHQH